MAFDSSASIQTTAMEAMAHRSIDIVDLPMKNGDFPHSLFVNVYPRVFPHHGPFHPQNHRFRNAQEHSKAKSSLAPVAAPIGEMTQIRRGRASDFFCTLDG